MFQDEHLVNIQFFGAKVAIFAVANLANKDSQSWHQDPTKVLSLC